MGGFGLTSFGLEFVPMGAPNGGDINLVQSLFQSSQKIGCPQKHIRHTVHGGPMKLIQMHGCNAMGQDGTTPTNHNTNR